MAESEEAFKVSVQETLKDLLQNGQHIDLKPEQEVVIRVKSMSRMSRLQTIYQILMGVKEKIYKASTCILMACPV